MYNGQAYRATMHNHRAALAQDAGLQLQRVTCDLLTFQTLVYKLQNLGSTTGVGLLKFCARYWRVEATSEWRSAKCHQASSGV